MGSGLSLTTDISIGSGISGPFSGVSAGAGISGNVPGGGAKNLQTDAGVLVQTDSGIQVQVD